MTDLVTWGRRLLDNLRLAIVGKDEVLRWAIVTLLCRGHLLIEDVPGVGKTTLARAIAVSIGCSLRRVQCTPDLMPSDLTGVSVFDQSRGDFVFRPGPLFSQVVLADEINRATPRTQSALLEAMEERQVSVDGETRPLPEPFFVIATQNPVEFAGTFPLPEAQLDRFFARLSLGYPDRAETMELFRRQRRRHPLDTLEPVTNAAELLAAQEAVRDVFVAEEVLGYAADLAEASRSHPDVALGISPRGVVALLRASQAKAALEGRNFVTPDDVKGAAPYVLAHRLSLVPESALRGRRNVDVVADLLEQVDPAVEGDAR